MFVVDCWWCGCCVLGLRSLVDSWVVCVYCLLCWWVLFGGFLNSVGVIHVCLVVRVIVLMIDVVYLGVV